MTETYFGGCLCGGITYECSEFEPQMAHCHCTMCRKFHGAGFATYAGVPRAKFRWLSGEALLKAYEAPNGTVRSFCSECGSSLTFFSPRANPDVIELALGTLETEPPDRPDAHIFVGSGVSWARIPDGLPKYRDGRSGPLVSKD